MTEQYQWKERSNAYYYHDAQTGKIIGKVNKQAVVDIWIALVYTGQYTFTVDDERHLGQYIDQTSAMNAVVHYWDIQGRTLIEG